MPNAYFRTEERRAQLESERSGRPVSDLLPSSQGTVGAVALDAAGDLAAATSTGGMTNKRQGRVGDSPIIGAGTYAKNGVCAVSATGHGEYFIRDGGGAPYLCGRGVSRPRACGRRYMNCCSRSSASWAAAAASSRSTGGGRIVTEFSTEGMFRGARDSSGLRQIDIY